MERLQRENETLIKELHYLRNENQRLTQENESLKSRFSYANPFASSVLNKTLSADAGRQYESAVDLFDEFISLDNVVAHHQNVGTMLTVFRILIC